MRLSCNDISVTGEVEMTIVCMLQSSLLLGHVLIVSGDFTVTSIMTVVLCPATASALRENTVLTELSLEGCHIDAEGTCHLLEALCVNTTLRVLDLSGNIVDSQGAEHLGKLSGEVWGYGLTCNSRWCQCATSNRKMSVVRNVNVNLRWSIAPVLRYCGPLLLVSLITQFMHVPSAFKNTSPRLFFFCTLPCGKSWEGCLLEHSISLMHTPPTHKLCACSLLQPSLLLGHVLVVSGDFTVTSIMTVVLCPATASALRGNKGLTELKLLGCDIDAEGTSHLVQALCDNTTLRVLNLSHNTVDSQSARHLGKLSGGVWGYGLTCNIRRCQCATSNRKMSALKVQVSVGARAHDVIFIVEGGRITHKLVSLK